jgi:hypothetical protein
LDIGLLAGPADIVEDDRLLDVLLQRLLNSHTGLRRASKSASCDCLSKSCSNSLE